MLLTGSTNDVQNFSFCYQLYRVLKGKSLKFFLFLQRLKSTAYQNSYLKFPFSATFSQFHCYTLDFSDSHDCETDLETSPEHSQEPDAQTTI